MDCGCIRSRRTDKSTGSTYSLIGDSLERDVSYVYSDFGETTVSGETSNEICYTGAVRDAATGMYYMNARYYDPETGRFISQDTYRDEDDDAGTWHLYAYCSNNPINYTDPSGYNPIAVGVVAVEGIEYLIPAIAVITIAGIAWASATKLPEVKKKQKKKHYYKAMIATDGNVYFRVIAR